MSQPSLFRKYTGVIQRLYTGIQCSSCAQRFKVEETSKYREHLDWHFRQNKKEKEDAKVVKFRKWYYELHVSGIPYYTLLNSKVKLRIYMYSIHQLYILIKKSNFWKTNYSFPQTKIHFVTLPFLN